MARHVDFRNDGHAAFGGIRFQFGTLRLRIETPRLSHGVGRLREAGESLHLEAPCEVFRQVPVERVDLEAREQVNFMFEFLETDERAAHVVHNAAQFEGWPIFNARRLKCCLFSSHLCERLGGADSSRPVKHLDSDLVWRDVERIALAGEAVQGVIINVGQAVHDFHVNAGLGLRHEAASRLCQHLPEKGRGGGVGEHHGALQLEGLFRFVRSDNLRLRQHVCQLRFCVHCAQKTEGKNEE
jgi:hypothetical protein